MAECRSECQEGTAGEGGVAPCAVCKAGSYSAGRVCVSCEAGTYAYAGMLSAAARVPCQPSYNSCLRLHTLGA
jgi:hypothetical protein